MTRCLSSFSLLLFIYYFLRTNVILTSTTVFASGSGNRNSHQKLVGSYRTFGRLHVPSSHHERRRQQQQQQRDLWIRASSSPSPLSFRLTPTATNNILTNIYGGGGGSLPNDIPESPRPTPAAVTAASTTSTTFLAGWFPPRLTSTVAQWSVGIPSILLGLLTFFPNGLMADSGTKSSQRASTVGLMASGLFVFAGVTVMINGTWIGIPIAITCQIIALSLLSPKN
jgi:hypothetical protein